MFLRGYVEEELRNRGIFEDAERGTIMLVTAGYSQQNHYGVSRQEGIKKLWKTYNQIRSFNAGGHALASTRAFYPFGKDPNLIKLVADPANSFDEYATQVWVDTNKMQVPIGVDLPLEAAIDLGFVPKWISESISKRLQLFTGGVIVLIDHLKKSELLQVTVELRYDLTKQIIKDDSLERFSLLEMD